MPFTARFADTNEVICALDYEHKLAILQAIGDRQLKSPYPDCQEPVFVVSSSLKSRLHFRHRKPVQTAYATHPESMEHRLGKLEIAKFFKAEMDRHNYGGRIVFEYPIESRKRIADVAVIYEDGHIQIGECQLAAITPEDIQQRSVDYSEQGMDVVWFLGKEALNYSNLYAVSECQNQLHSFQFDNVDNAVRELLSA